MILLEDALIKYNLTIDEISAKCEITSKDGKQYVDEVCIKNILALKQGPLFQEDQDNEHNQSIKP